jgi:hypothetical protein
MCRFVAFAILLDACRQMIPDAVTIAKTALNHPSVLRPIQRECATIAQNHGE